MKKLPSGKTHRIIKVSVSAVLIIVIAAIFLIIPLRPTHSDTEKRKLTEFPDFSFSALADGSYFSEITKWYSDTVPFRDTLVSINIKLQNLLGTSGAVRGFEEGGNGDEIPEVNTDNTNEVDNSEPVQSSEPETFAPEEVTYPPANDKNANIEQLGYIAVCGDAGYEYYNFVQSTADNYVKALNTAGAKFSGTSKVFATVIPNSTDITLDDKNREKLDSSVSDQKKAITYMLSNTSSSVNTFDCFETLKMHRNEYVYFRTDHHWTALGAYYAYMEFCKTKGISALALDEFEIKSYDNFLGTFYADSNHHPSLEANPDVVDTYIPPCDYSMTITQADGSTGEWPLLYDETNASSSLKYSTFICGDNPLSTITNASNPDGETCLVIKESFGNAFVPFLVYHYKTVYVIDYRYYKSSLSSFMSSHSVDDILFLNNISMTRNADLVSTMAAFIAG